VTGVQTCALPIFRGVVDAATITSVTPLTNGLPASAPKPVCTINDPAYSLTCTIVSLPVGASVTLIISGDIKDGLDSGDRIDNTASAVSRATSEIAGGAPNSATAQIVIIPAADLAITKSVSPLSAVPGQPVVWTLHITNNGPSAANEIVAIDTLLDPNLATIGPPGQVTITGPPGVTVTVAPTGREAIWQDMEYAGSSTVHVGCGELVGRPLLTTE
jgi:uncharacterized repeat protein (TIGR01451 family)